MKKFHDALRELGVSRPEAETKFLDEEAVAGVVRWAQDEAKRGRIPTSYAIVHKLRGGGLTGYGSRTNSTTDEWWRSTKGRLRWIEANVPSLDSYFAEYAIVSLVQAKQNISSSAVLAVASQLRDTEERDA